MFYYALENRVNGPVAAERLHDLFRIGTIGLETRIIRAGNRDWTTYYTVMKARPPMGSPVQTEPGKPVRISRSHGMPAAQSVTRTVRRGLASLCWLLLAVTAVLTFFPVPGFTPRSFAGLAAVAVITLLFITLMKGGTRDGLLVLLCTLLIFPLLLLFVPLHPSRSGPAFDSATAPAAYRGSHSAPGYSNRWPAPLPRLMDPGASGKLLSAGVTVRRQPGENVQLSDSDWIVFSAKETGNSPASPIQVQGNSQPAKLVTVKFRVTNTTRTDAPVSDPPKLIDSRGRRFSPLADSSLNLPAGVGQMTLKQIPAGTGKTFDAIYKIPADATGLAFEARALGLNPELAAVNLNL